MTDTKPDQWTAKAAQLWCLPNHGKKEMDCDFAFDIAAALRLAHKQGVTAGKIEAFEEAEFRAQIEVNACRHHAQVSKGANKRLHEAAQGIAQVIVYFCTQKAASLRAPAKGKGL